MPAARPAPRSSRTSRPRPASDSRSRASSPAVRSDRRRFRCAQTMRGLCARRWAWVSPSFSGTSPRRVRGDRVRRLDQSMEDRLTLGLPEIEGHALLVAVERVEEHAVVLCEVERPTSRAKSPPSGGSILMTSAPWSARNMVPKGPAPYCSTVNTRTPARGWLIGGNDGPHGPSRNAPNHHSAKAGNPLTPLGIASHESLSRSRMRRRAVELLVPASARGPGASGESAGLAPAREGSAGAEHGRTPQAGFRFTSCFEMMSRCSSLVPSPIASSGASR